jgi:hypothetical protein
MSTGNGTRELLAYVEFISAQMGPKGQDESQEGRVENEEILKR